jgi:hypothetical protein
VVDPTKKQKEEAKKRTKEAKRSKKKQQNKKKKEQKKQKSKRTKKENIFFGEKKTPVLGIKRGNRQSPHFQRKEENGDGKEASPAISR